MSSPRQKGTRRGYLSRQGHAVESPAYSGRETVKIKMRSMAAGVAVIIVGFITAAAVLSPEAGTTASTAGRSGLSFEERLQYQQKIEEVYFKHRLWPGREGDGKPLFNEAVPASVVREKIANSLRKSAALERYWNHEITGEQLQMEVERMARETRQPGLLAELFSALDNDPYIIAECLARPILAERLLRNWYARDSRFHADLRARAEADLSQHTSLESMRHSSGRLTEVETVKVDREADGPSGDGVREVRPAEWERVVSQLNDMFAAPRECEDCPGQIASGDLPRRRFSSLQEDDDRFYAVAVISRSAGRIRVAVAEWEKRAFDSWWSDEKTGFSTEVKETAYAFQAAKLTESPQSNCTDDTWRPTKALPEGTSGHTAVWTGVEMIVWGGGTNFGGKTNTGAKYNPATDTWTRISAIEAPAPRAGHTAVWTGTEMIVWGGCGQASDFCALNTGGRYNPVTDTWRPTSLTNAPTARTRHTAVWTGSRMIVWGGCRPEYNNGNCTSRMTATGGQYNPVTDTWTPTSTVNAPAPRVDHTAVWTGTEMIVWGGYFALNTGGRYNPVTDTWVATNTATAPEGRRAHTAVWTGAEMIVWGGFNSTNASLNTGGRYSPSTDSWTATSTAGAPSARGYHTAVWTGLEMIVWGGLSAPAGGSPTNTGGRYNPSTDSWQPTSIAGAPPPRYGHTAVWTGSLMIVWGARYDKTGGRYNPATDTWQPTDTNDAPQQLYNHAAIWTGTEMLVWGESGEGVYAMVGSRYNPATYSWQPMSIVNRPEVRDRAFTAVWTGVEMIVWGGQYGSFVYDTGGRYNPLTDTWTATSTVGAPSARADHVAVWTGVEMIVWGGTDGTLTNTGGRYNPSTDSWQPASAVGAPTGRYLLTAVWTGSVMIVWGGVDSTGHVNTGGKYNPSTDSWQPTSTAGTPEPRRGHGAVWTGTEMIVWGGRVGDFNSSIGFFNNGARYNPATDGWTPVSTAGAPARRAGHTTVWTGSEMIVWGGRSPGVIYVDGIYTGGRYSPATDTWRATSVISAPSGRESHTAVWTGSDMIVWGGLVDDTTSYTTSGGHYCVAVTATCPASMTPESQSFSSTGGEGSVSVTTPDGCSWQVSSNASWIVITSTNSNTSSSTVNYLVRDNTTEGLRTGTMTIADHTFTITQDGLPISNCAFTISPSYASVAAAGGSGSLQVTTESRCAWQASSDADWITITSSRNGAGLGTLSYSVAANTGKAGRKGTITVSGKVFTVKQKGG